MPEIADQPPKPARTWRPIVLWPRAICILLVFASAPGIAMANAAIPGPIFSHGVMNARNPVLWMVLTMTMCITIEGAIYHYQGRILHPYRASVVANLISMALGFVFFSMVGALLSDMVIIPTLLSILSEVLIVGQYETAKGKADQWPVLWAVVVGNLVTNGILIIYLAVK